MSKVSAELLGQTLRSKYPKLAKIPVSVPIGAGIAAASWLWKKHAINKVLRDVDTPDTEEGVRLFKALRKKAKDDGVSVTLMPSPLDGSSSYYMPAGDAITVGRRADLLAHEYGHSQYSAGRGGIVGRTAHKLYLPSKILGTVNPISVSVSVLGSALPGSAAKKLTALSAASGVPLLVAEAAASRKGYEALRELGASDEYLKNTRRNLFNAWSTYAGDVGTNIGADMLTGGLVDYVKTRIKDRKNSTH